MFESFEEAKRLGGDGLLQRRKEMELGKEEIEKIGGSLKKFSG